MRLLIVTVAALGLSGCASVGYIMENYHGVEEKDVTVPGDTDYRVFDRPDLGKIMVTPTIGASAGQGMLKGLTLMAVDATPPKPRFQKAVETYLAETNRASCRVTDGYVLASPQFEFTYLCSGVQKPKPAT